MTDQSTATANMDAGSTAFAKGWTTPDRLLLIAFVIALLAFSPALLNLGRVWFDSEEYGHGLIVPLIALYIYWLNRCDMSSQPPLHPSWVALLPAATGGLLYLLGALADVDVATYYGLLIGLAALPLALGGWRLAKAAWYPLLLVLFVIPLPYLFSTLLTTKMQLVSSDIGVAFIRLFGLPVMQDGNVLHMGSFTMLVEEACSGLRYMYPLVSIGLIVAYFYRGPVWQKLLIVVSTVPITIGMNSLRIAVTGLIIRYLGADAAEGFLHSFEGWIVFMLAFGMLMLEIWVLTRLFASNESFVQRLAIRTPAPKATLAYERDPRPQLAAAVLVILAFGAGTAVTMTMATSTVPERESFASLPFVIGEREVFPDRLSANVLSVLRPDDYFVGDYKNTGSRASMGAGTEQTMPEQLDLPSAVPISLYLVYYGEQKEGSVLHSPRACLPGGGWVTESSGKVSLADMGGIGDANRVVISRGGKRMLVYYWIHQQGENFADEFVARASLLMQSLLHGRTDGGLVRVIVSLPGGDRQADGYEAQAGVAEEAMRGFVADLMPSLPRFMPK